MNELQRRKRIMAVLSIILDGAQAHDIVDFVRQQEQADKPEAIWQVTSGADPLTDEQIADMARQAEQMIADENPGVPAAVAMHAAKLKSLYARCVAAGEHATAARILKDIATFEQAQGDTPPAIPMGEAAAGLLLEIRRRHLEIANETVTYLNRREWEIEMESGPIFKPLQWSGGDDAGRMRLQRAMVELLEEGLVVEDREPGARWGRVRLSEKGEAIIESVAQDAGGE